MDQPYTKENIEAAMEHVRTLLDQVNALESMFPGRHFTLDGHPVGSVGEVAAAYHYGIELFPPSTELHDGYAGDRNIQIKITQTENVLIGEESEYVIVLYSPGREISTRSTTGRAPFHGKHRASLTNADISICASTS